MLYTSGAIVRRSDRNAEVLGAAPSSRPARGQQTVMSGSGPSSTRRRGVGRPIRPFTAALAVAAALAGAFSGAPSAYADPVGAPTEGSVPSSPPASTTFADGVTLSLAASDETQVPIPALTPDQISRDVIVGGIFTGSIRNAGFASGTLEVGYQVGCDSPNGMLFGIIDQLKRGETSVAVTKQEFTGRSPKVEIEGYRLHIDRCAGPAFIRSYAILTRAAAQTSSVVYYYGFTKPVAPVDLPG